jgi:hypothetical protein
LGGPLREKKVTAATVAAWGDAGSEQPKNKKSNELILTPEYCILKQFNEVV